MTKKKDEEKKVDTAPPVGQNGLEPVADINVIAINVVMILLALFAMGGFIKLVNMADTSSNVYGVLVGIANLILIVKSIININNQYKTK